MIYILGNFVDWYDPMFGAVYQREEIPPFHKARKMIFLMPYKPAIIL